MNQDNNNDIMQANANTTNSQSRAFELISQISYERDNYKETILQYEKVMKSLATILNIEDNTPQAISSEIQKLKSSQLSMNLNNVE